MNFEQFKTTVCEALGLDPDNLPEGVEFDEYPAQRVNGESFYEEFRIECNGRPVVRCYFEFGRTWSFKGLRYDTLQLLIEDNPTAVRAELGLEQPKQSPSPVKTIYQFKQSVCGKLGVDPDNTPDGWSWNELETEGGYRFTLVLWRGGYDTILSKHTYDIFGEYKPWRFRGRTYASLDEIDTAQLKKALDLPQPTATTSHTVDSLAPLFMQSLLSNPELVADTPQVMAANAVAHAEALIRMMGGVAGGKGNNTFSPTIWH